MALSRNVKEAVISIILILLTIFLYNEYISYKKHTLYEDARWESTKTKLKRGVCNTWCMMLTNTALSRNELNISAWQGYQDLVYIKKICPQSVQFKCKSSGYPFCFYTNKTDSFSEGFFFNYTQDTLCCFFKANQAGQFVFKKDFSIGRELNRDQWNTFELQFNPDSSDLIINSKHFGKWPVAGPCVSVGFRGSRKDIYVDDVCFVNAAGKKVMIDDFAPPFHLNLEPFILLFFLTLVFVLFRKNRVYLSFLSLIITATVFAVYFWHTSALYPGIDDHIDFMGKDSRVEDSVTFRKRLDKEYPLEKFAGRKNIILFVGSSQTWGAGTSVEGKTMPELVQRNLRDYLYDTTITVIDCGMSGLTSDRLLTFYTRGWMKYKPVVTVIDLSANDADTAVFRASIHRFLELNQAQNINTVLIAEPNDLLHNEFLDVKHNILKEEGMKFKRCTVVEVQQYMDSCNTKGFIWWDCVHLTDYGYQLLAEKVTGPIMKAMKETPGDTLRRSNR